MRIKVINAAIALATCLAVSGDRHVQANIYDEQTAWYPEVEELFEADRYCSPESAARALSRKLARAFASSADDNTRFAVNITVKTNEGAWVKPKDVRWAFAEELRNWEKGVFLVAGDQPADRTLLVEVDIEAKAAANGKQATGTIRVRAENATTERMLSANFVDKGWVTQNRLTSDLVCVRGLGSDSEFGARDVLEKAIDDQLLERIMRLSGEYGMQDAWARNQIRELLVRDLEQWPIVRDRFQQTFYRSMDDISHAAIAREAVLLDLSESNVGELTDHVVNRLHRVQRHRKGAMFFGTISMLAAVAIGLVGNTALNHWTRGYYVWPIRFATVTYLLLSVGIAATMTIATISRL